MIGKWNKSVILSYAALLASIVGIILLCEQVDVKYAFICLMIAGICDMFDGTIARKCKRTKEEQLFGIELDSLLDVFNFVAYPIIISIFLGIHGYECIPVYFLYGMFGVARLGHFNITTEDTNKPRKYYEGLPVTTAALLFPLMYLLSYAFSYNVFYYVYLACVLAISVLFILRIHIPKPKTKATILPIVIFGLIIAGVYLFVL